MENTGLEQGRAHSERVFIKGLLAAISLRGVTRISTLNRSHQDRFKGVIGELERRRKEGDESARRMPRLWPRPISGDYEDWDSLLIELQSADVTQCLGPYFLDVRLVQREQRALKYLECFSPDEVSLLSDLATCFLSYGVIKHDFVGVQP